MTDTEREALCTRIDELCAEVERLHADQAHWELGNCPSCPNVVSLQEALDQNAKLREMLERIQPTDSEGNELDIADTVHMLRSDYDGDHEWDDVVIELAIAKWGGDRWIVRGSKGEAWACDCTKTGYDEDAFEDSDDVEPFDDATLAEAENAKLRELCSGLAQVVKNDDDTFRRLREIAKQELSCDFIGMYDSSLGKIDQIVRFIDSMAELGIEVIA